MNFTILASLIIILLGVFFRILPYDNVQGLWNDEYVGWAISQKPLFTEFIKGILAQCHMPVYYIYLKFITTLFGNSDVVLRLSSFLAGFISIIVMYFVGKEKDEKLGLLCAFFAAISGFLIYFSYEVRPYSLIFLFSAFSLLYTLRLLYNPTEKNFIYYLISNLLIIFTHTIGVVYVICNILLVGHFLKNKNQNFTRKIFLYTGIVFLLLTPLIVKIFTTVSFSQWWSNFSISKLLFMLTDLFSNYLINIINAPANFFSSIGWGFFIFAIIPTVIASIGIINSLFIEKSYTKSLCLMVCCVTFILFTASFSGKIIFLTKYNIEIYPVLIYLSMLGLYSIKNKFLKILLIIIFFSTNIFYLFTDNFKNKFYKSESNKLAVELFKNARLKKGDSILFTYYPSNRFDKYYDRSKFNNLEIHKGNFNNYLTPDTSYEKAVTESKNLYKSVYMSNKNQHFNDIIKRDVLDKLNNGDKLGILFLNSVEMFSDVQIFQLTTDEKLYNKTPQMYLIFSYIKNRLLKTASHELKFLRYEQNGEWSLAVFEKP